MSASPARAVVVCPCPNCGCGANVLREYSFEQYALRLEELVGTNVPPSDEELVVFSTSIVEEKDFISAVDDHIASLERALRDLKQHRVEAEHRLSKYKCVTHPIRRIPPDLLADMFIACLDRDWIIQQRSSTASVGRGSLDVRAPPWTLAQVSVVWRNVALNRPQLWTHIRVPLPTSTAVNTDYTRPANPAKILRAQIIRADSAPLSIALVTIGNALIPSSHPLVSLLLSTAPRWRELFLSVRFASLSCLSEVQSHLPLLKIVNLRLWDMPQGGPGVPLNLFRDAPSLRTIIGDQSIFYLTFSENVTEYRSLMTQTLGSLLSIAERQARLQKLDIPPPSGNRYSSGAVPPTTTLSEVQTLIVAPPAVSTNSSRSSSGAQHERELDPAQVLRSLTLPSLQELTLCGKIDLDAMKQFLDRSNAPLSTLSITSQSMDHSQIVQLLTLVPNLSSLSIDCQNAYSNQVLEALTTRRRPTGDQSFDLLPKIRRMIFVGNRGRAEGFVKRVKDMRVDSEVYFMDTPM